MMQLFPLSFQQMSLSFTLLAYTDGDVDVESCSCLKTVSVKVRQKSTNFDPNPGRAGWAELAKSGKGGGVQVTLLTPAWL